MCVCIRLANLLVILYCRGLRTESQFTHSARLTTVTFRPIFEILSVRDSNNRARSGRTTHVTLLCIDSIRRILVEIDF